MFKRFGLWDILLIAIVGCALIFRVPQWYKSFAIQGDKFPQTATVYDLNGAPEQIPSDTKQALIFWATWCGPCTMELARVQKMIDKNEIPPEKILAVSLDQDLATLKRTLAERAYTFRVVHDATQSASKLFGIEVTPTIYFLNGDRTVEWNTSGVSPTLELRLSRFLGRP